VLCAGKSSFRVYEGVFGSEVERFELRDRHVKWGRRQKRSDRLEEVFVKGRLPRHANAANGKNNSERRATLEKRERYVEKCLAFAAKLRLHESRDWNKSRIEAMPRGAVRKKKRRF